MQTNIQVDATTGIRTSNEARAFVECAQLCAFHAVRGNLYRAGKAYHEALTVYRKIYPGGEMSRASDMLTCLDNWLARLESEATHG